MAYLLGVSEREGPAWDPELIGAWDRELAAGPFVGWAGSDAHGGIEVAGGRFLRWPSYESIFGMVRNHLRLAGPLTGEPARDRRLIYDALRQGSGYVAVGRSSGDRSFRFSVEADGVVWPMGSDVPLSANLGFTARAGIADPDARLVLLRDGMPLSEARGGSLIFESQQPGVYRVEARGGDGWILSNPVTILSAPEIEARRGVRALPVPPVPEMGDSRPYPLEFNVEPTPGCRSLEVEPDTWGPGSLRVRFSLGVPPRGAPDTVNDPWARCALADRRSHDLEGEMGIRFETRGDAIYRVSLFLADRDPDDGAPQFWATSFLTGKDWREIVIPFSQLEGLSRPRRLLEQGSVSEISFFLDTSNTRPGTTGEIGVRGVELISTRDTSRP
jgi:hypothetical protein